MGCTPKATGLSSAILLASRDALLICRKRSRSASVMSHPTYQGSLLVTRVHLQSAALAAARCAVGIPLPPLGPSAPWMFGVGMPVPAATHRDPRKRLSAPWWAL